MTGQPQQDAPTQPDENASQPKPGRAAALKNIAQYAKLGFAPVIAIIALAVAVIAFSANRSSQAQLTAVLGKLDVATAALKASKNEAGSLKTDLAALKAELSSLKAEIAQHKAHMEEARKNQEALNEKIVQNVSKIQAKQKISPTLEEQLKPDASAPAAAPPASSAKTTPAVPKKTSPQTQAIREAIEKFNQKR